jgi:hypothetical protein
MDGSVDVPDWTKGGTRTESGVLGCDCRDGDSSGFNSVCTCRP